MRLSTYVVTVPIVVAAVVLAVANRNPVGFSLDPFSAAAPALAVVMPLYLLLFLTFLLGVLVGGLVVAVNRRRVRNAASRPGLLESARQALSSRGSGTKSRGG